MERISVATTKRDTGKGPARRLRVSGKIPAVLYGKTDAPLSLAVDSHEMENLTTKASGSTLLVDLDVEGKSVTALVRDFQADPFKRHLTHIDFQAVGLEDKIHVEVPVKLVGSPKGVKEGGILEQLRRTVDVKCQVSKIPSKIEVDVTELDVGDNIQARDLNLGAGVEFAHTANYAIAAVVPPTKVEEVVAPTAAAAEGEEGAAPAEGEAPAGEEKPAEGGEGEKKEE